MVVRHTARRWARGVALPLLVAASLLVPDAADAAVKVIQTPPTANPVQANRAPGHGSPVRSQGRREGRRLHPRVRRTPMGAATPVEPATRVAPGASPTAPAPAAAPAIAAVAPTPARVEPFLSRPALAPSWSPAELERVTRQWFADHPDMDSAVVTTEAGGARWSLSLRRRGTDPGVAPDVPYLALSITKTVTAALVLREVEKGTLTLDGPLPSITGIDAPEGVTVRNLLAHESGLADYRESTSYDERSFLGPRDAVLLSLRAPRVAAPGTVTHYANSNFLYLQLILEKVTGRPYDRLLSELVRSVGMSSTDLRPADRPGWPAGAAGGMWSTTEDLVQWMGSLFTPGVVLGEPMLRQLAAYDGRAMTLGLWRICPCSSVGGVTRYTAIGHHVAVGGTYFLPEVGASVAVRIGPSGDLAAGETADLVVRLAELAGAPRR